MYIDIFYYNYFLTFHFMKKIISSILSFALFLSMTTLTQAKTHAESLVDTIRDTIESPNIQAEIESSMIYGSKNKINFIEKVQDNKEKMKGNMTVNVSLDSSDWPMVLQNSLENMNFSLKGEIDFEVFFNKDSLDIYLGYDNFNMETETTDKEIKTIVEGFSEIPKLFSGKVFNINFKKILGDDRDLEVLLDLLKSFTKEDLSLMYETMIKSNIFDVKIIDNNKYSLTLAENFSDIDFGELFKGMESFMVIPEQKIMLNSVIMSIDNMTEQDKKSAEDMWNKINNFINLSIIIDTQNNKIKNIDVEIKIDIKGLILSIEPSASEEVKDFKEIVIKESADLYYKDIDINYSTLKKNTVDISKIVEAVKASTERAMKKFNNYRNNIPKNNVNGMEWENTMINNITPKVINYNKPDGISKIAERRIKNIPEDAWYREHAKELLLKGLISEVNPERKVTKEFMRKLMSEIIKEPVVFLEVLEDSNSLISKFDAIEIMTKILFPHVENPFEFAIENGFIKADSNRVNFKNNTAIEAEIYKIIVEMLHLYESQF